MSDAAPRPLPALAKDGSGSSPDTTLSAHSRACGALLAPCRPGSGSRARRPAVHGAWPPRARWCRRGGPRPSAARGEEGMRRGGEKRRGGRGEGRGGVEGGEGRVRAGEEETRQAEAGGGGWFGGGVGGACGGGSGGGGLGEGRGCLQPGALDGGVDVAPNRGGRERCLALVLDQVREQRHLLRCKRRLRLVHAARL